MKLKQKQIDTIFNNVINHIMLIAGYSLIGSHFGWKCGVGLWLVSFALYKPIKP